ncbi:Homocysteine S-methyltransferase 2 [Acorus gramineus]|uniref:Homocysteine S-methyltransferase 2 n=1 Tax=Acorus gramineus TaxID=55184 RepID=A0AAV9AU81_ACOGR|nr:Homocysteine S-methyltransferase 2 [Acorus gramineus]
MTSFLCLHQATIQGFESKGISREESENLLRKSAEIACEARDIFLERCTKGCYSGTGGAPKNHPVLVAASRGSYGAYLADGSEYSGEYGEAVTLAFLKDFHRRVQVLAESSVEIIAFETIPNKIEAQAYVELLEENDIKIPAWLSFNSKDGVNVVSGDSLHECASIANLVTRFVLVQLHNYESLSSWLSPLIDAHLPLMTGDRWEVTSKPIIIYPNSGETYDADRKEWVESTGVPDEDFVPYVSKWREAGASLIGGCCRTTPNTIRAISRALNITSVIKPQN